jgi:hypothetical protein
MRKRSVWRWLARGERLVRFATHVVVLARLVRAFFS